MSLEILKSVATELRNLGYIAKIDNTGGGLMGIYVTLPGIKKEVLFGTDGGWGADLYDEEGEFTNGIYFDEIKDTDSPFQIAYTVVQAILCQYLGATDEVDKMNEEEVNFRVIGV